MCYVRRSVCDGDVVYVARCIEPLYSSPGVVCIIITGSRVYNLIDLGELRYSAWFVLPIRKEIVQRKECFPPGFDSCYICEDVRNRRSSIFHNRNVTGREREREGGEGDREGESGAGRGSERGERREMERDRRIE